MKYMCRYFVHLGIAKQNTTFWYEDKGWIFDITWQNVHEYGGSIAILANVVIQENIDFQWLRSYPTAIDLIMCMETLFLHKENFSSMGDRDFICFPASFQSSVRHKSDFLRYSLFPAGCFPINQHRARGFEVFSEEYWKPMYKEARICCETSSKHLQYGQILYI